MVPIVGALAADSTSPGGSGSVSPGAREKAESADPRQALDRNAFLRLLTTELRYQDPLQPVKDQEFIAQLAQFSALEQMENLAKTMTAFSEHQVKAARLAQATALLGREVDLDDGQGGVLTGRVEAIRLKDGVPWLLVGGHEAALDTVVTVR